MAMLMRTHRKQSWASHSQICKQMQQTHTADGCFDTDASDGDTPQAQVTIAADLPVPQTGTENSAQEGQVVIKSERPDDGYVLHLTSSAPAELVQLSNSGDAFNDLNVKTKVQDLGCTLWMTRMEMI